MPERAVPEHARLLADFANTLAIDGEERTELLDSPPALAGWLSDRGLLTGTARVSGADLELALALRTGLREAMTAHHDDSEAPHQELDVTAAKIPLRVAFDGPLPQLEPAGQTAIDQALGALLVAVADAAADGSWPRLKLCASGSCREAFYDASRNRCRTWCSMEVCGNREKTRAYRARQHALTSP